MFDLIKDFKIFKNADGNTLRVISTGLAIAGGALGFIASLVDDRVSEEAIKEAVSDELDKRDRGE